MDEIVKELCDKLRHPSDMGKKLDTVCENAKRTYESEYERYNLRMGNGYKQLERLKNDVESLLDKSEEFASGSEKNFEVLKDFNSLVSDYNNIEYVCRMFQTFKTVKDLFSELKNINDDYKDDDIIKYHRNIYKEEDFMWKLNYYKSGISVEDKEYIEKTIDNLKRHIVEFNALLLEIADDLVNNTDLFGSLNQIVAIEEERDERTRETKEGLKNVDKKSIEVYKLNREYSMRECQNLRNRIRRTIVISIENKFSIMKEKDRICIAKLHFIYEDLEKLNNATPLEFFPMSEFLNVYHENLTQLVDYFVPNLDAGDILLLIEFKTNYYNKIESEYNRVAESLGPRMIKNEKKLLEKYAGKACEKLEEWISGIANLEIEKLKTRNPEFTRSEDGSLISPGFIRLLEIIKMQLEPISFDDKILLHITRAVKTYCEDFRVRIMESLKKEFELFNSGKSQSGFEDYCIIFANSGIRLTQYLTSLPQCQKLEVRELGQIFMKISEGSNRYLVKFIMKTCFPVTKKIFTRSWETSEMNIGTWICTMKDFLDDYKQNMLPFGFLNLVMELTKYIVIVYVESLAKKDVVINKNTWEILEEEHKQHISLLGTYAPINEVEDILSFLERLESLLKNRNPELIIIDIKTLKSTNPKFTYEIASNIIQNKPGINPELKNKLLDDIKSIFLKTSEEKQTYGQSLFNLKRYLSK